MRLPPGRVVLRLSFALMGASAAAQTPILRLADVQAGMKGTGRTVFSGTRIEEFQVEILGVLENIAPKQSLIVARLSGGPLEKVGVLQGMSGSPVYIGGKLAGAVAMAFPFSKEPLAGIRPIEDMLAAGGAPPAPPARAASTGASVDLLAGLARPADAVFGQSRLTEIATPVSFAGFTAATLDRFSPQLRALGLEPVQGVSGRGRATAGGPPGPVEPGSMISVQLMTGDLSIAADGTVTHVEGNRLWAFGHRFLAVGSTDLPFSRAEVLALLPSVQSSFKISASREIAGAISQDRSAAVAGQIGRKASLLPLRISAGKAAGNVYRMEMVNDRFLSPFLLQMSLYSAIDSTERVVGAGTLAVRGAITFEGSYPPLRLDNVFAADTGAASLASLMTALPLAYVMQGGFDSLKVKSIDLGVAAFDEKRQLQIDQVFPARPNARPGETVELTVSLAGEKGAEVTRKIAFRVPEGVQPGPLYFTVSDATTANLAELRQIILTQPKSAAQLLGVVNRLRANTKAYVRIWRAEPSYQVQTSELPDPPPSVGLLLAKANSSQGVLTQSYQSKVAEFEIDSGGRSVSGLKSAQVEIKE